MTGIIPFSFVRAVVTGDNFIGRKLELDTLRSYVLENKTTFVVGLPRMGKTSLVKQCFFFKENYQYWLEEENMAPIYISVNTSRDSSYFWKAIARQIWLFLNTRKIHYKDLDEFAKITSADELYQIVMKVLGDIKQEMCLSFIIVLDEFDGVRHYSKEDDIFVKIRSLNEYGVVVTCSRRTPEHIEKMVTGSKYFTGNGEKVFITPFDDEEVEEYWNHFSNYFSCFSSKQFEENKRLVDSYVGSHPMLMSWMNNWLFSQKKQPLAVWNPKMPETQRAEIERSMRVGICKEFLRQMDYVREQELESTAKQMVIGASHTIDESEMDLLLRYKFIKEVASDEKREIFGYDIGPTVGDDLSRRYMCFSALTSHIMKDTYDPDIKGYELLKTTELRLRALISVFLQRLCNTDYPFELDHDNRELWEEVLFERVYNRLSDEGRDTFQRNLDEMYRIRMKREKNDCNPTFNRKRINMVSSATLGQLWFVFIKWHWDSFFGPVLDNENECHGNADRWYNLVFVSILKWRNAANHYYDEELSDKVITEASNHASRVCHNIESWLDKVR